MRFDWFDLPFYDQAWYEYKRATMSPEKFAQEIEINYTVSLTGRIYP
jgi:hypothetical protein